MTVEVMTLVSLIITVGVGCGITFFRLAHFFPNHIKIFL